MIENFIRDVGEKLYVKFQLFDKADNKRVFATVRDQNNVVVYPRFELPLLQDGFYEETDKVMIDRPEIKAFFEVTELDGSTDAGYFFTYDVFSMNKQVDVSNIDISVNRRQVIEAETQSQDLITAMVESQDVLAVVESNTCN